jgi:hypothetical protein
LSLKNISDFATESKKMSEQESPSSVSSKSSSSESEQQPEQQETATVQHPVSSEPDVDSYEESKSSSQSDLMDGDESSSSSSETPVKPRATKRKLFVEGEDDGEFVTKKDGTQ